MKVGISILVLIFFAVAMSPAYANDYTICLTENRSDWPGFGIQARRFKSFHVVPDPDDRDQRLMEALVTGVENEGLIVSSGPLEEAPDGTEIIITFEANWTWDFGYKLHESVVFFRDAETFRVLLVASQFGHILASMPTVEAARMVNRLNSPDLDRSTPLCWSDEPID
jgi:hypothetical protein